MKLDATLFRCLARRLVYRFYDLLVPIWLGSLGVRFLGRSQFVGFPEITMAPESLIEIGGNGLFISSNFSTALGVSHPIIIRTLAGAAEIRIGHNVGISGGSICSAKKITIGDECLLGADVMICDTDFHPLQPNNRWNSGLAYQQAKPVQIGRNVFLGTRVVVLKGVTIGDCSVIGAGSVVTRDIPENVVAGGNPCRILRPLSQERTSNT